MFQMACGVVILNSGNVYVENERIYWDQATILAQAGLIDSQNLPVLEKSKQNW